MITPNLKILNENQKDAFVERCCIMLYEFGREKLSKGLSEPSKQEIESIVWKAYHLTLLYIR